MGGLSLASTSLDSRSHGGGGPCYFYNAVVLESSSWRWVADSVAQVLAVCAGLFLSTSQTRGAWEEGTPVKK